MYIYRIKKKGRDTWGSLFFLLFLTVLSSFFLLFSPSFFLTHWSWLEIFYEFSNAIFIVRSRPPQIVFRQITTKKNHVWMSLFLQPPHRKTSPPCRKIMFNVSSNHNRSVKRFSNLYLVLCCLCVFSQTKKWYFVLCWGKKCEGMLVVMCDDDWEDEEGIWFFLLLWNIK